MNLDPFKDPLFKGCTRPSMLADVPMIPFLLVTGIFMLATMYTFILVNPFAALGVILLYAPIYVWLRLITKKDDQRLHQMLLKLRMRLRMKAARNFWGAASYSPLRYKRSGK
jgi:type IV secretion system protein VirB3